MTGEGLTVPVPRARTVRCVRCARRTAAALPVQVSGRTRAACPRCGPDLAPGPSWDESPRPVAVSARAIRMLRFSSLTAPVVARLGGGPGHRPREVRGTPPGRGRW
ncbi:hypothetical protein [Streptomyces sp. NPDC002490]|uniref:hypothetical protein n=1 Tax=Streptomyces sp. NPDC002490 TaxID=3154416 RepID=UPI003327C707